MRITSGTLSINIAKAYGVTSPMQSGAVSNTTPMRAAQVVDSFQPSSSINKLIAGRVPQSVEFSGQSTPAASAQRVLQMYTRAADKIEAAVAVQVGRTIDLRG